MRGPHDERANSSAVRARRRSRIIIIIIILRPPLSPRRKLGFAPARLTTLPRTPPPISRRLVLAPTPNNPSPTVVVVVPRPPSPPPITCSRRRNRFAAEFPGNICIRAAAARAPHLVHRARITFSARRAFNENGTDRGKRDEINPGIHGAPCVVVDGS